MTHDDPQLHLSEDEVLRAMIDPSNLDSSRQAHVNACRHCQRQTEALSHRLIRLGQMAKQMTPEPQKSFRLPAHSTPVGRWRLKPAMALGVLGILIFAVVLWGPRFYYMSPSPGPMVVHTVESDDRLLQEIDMLVEDALPEQYQRLAALSDDRSVEDLDALIDWVVPSPGEAEEEESPASSGRDSRQEPLAWSNFTITAERRMV